MAAMIGLVRRLWGRERALAWTGALGVALGLGCAAAIVARGTAHVPPGGDLEKAASFDLAIGIYVLTLAALVPFSGFGPRSRAAWRVATIVTALYFYFGETFPTLRGLDPRFTETTSGPDMVIATLFAIDAGIVTLLFAAFAVAFFVRRAGPDRPGLVLGVRWACAAAAVAFGIGFWMIGAQGRVVGLEGSALPAHALGFHALQAVPLVGWLTDRRGLGRGWVHAAGALWVAATLAAAAQAAAGRPPLAPDPPTLLSVVFLLGWAGVVLAALARHES